jgi:hypothetical protein
MAGGSVDWLLMQVHRPKTPETERLVLPPTRIAHKVSGTRRPEVRHQFIEFAP